MTRGMRCFGFASREKEQRTTQAKRSPSGRSNSSGTSTDRDMRRSASESSFNASDISDSFGRTGPMVISSRSNNLRIFTYQELRNATRSFNRALLLGEGGFGCVYRGSITSVLPPKRSQEIAVKQLGRKGLQGHKEWQTEINILGMVDHPNLVKLLGYCAEEDERGLQLLLVYEFMPNGSLGDHISVRCQRPLPWHLRLRIALDTARGLKYLHEDAESKIVFRDLKPSNILLDENWNAKLSDFGLARLIGPQDGTSHVSTAVVGTMGYASPEYMLTGRLTKKNDVWSYGVVLYELITGRRPIDKNRPKAEQNLLEWVKPYTSDAKALPAIIDPRMEGLYSLKAIVKLASVANKCLMRQPRSRPRMSEVTEMLQKIVLYNETGVPTAPVSTPATPQCAKEEREGEAAKHCKRKAANVNPPAPPAECSWNKLWILKLTKAH